MTSDYSGGFDAPYRFSDDEYEQRLADQNAHRRTGARWSPYCRLSCHFASDAADSAEGLPASSPSTLTSSSSSGQ
jgi:hypothetical protein